MPHQREEFDNSPEALEKLKNQLVDFSSRISKEADEEKKSKQSDEPLNFNPDQMKSGAGDRPKMPSYVGTKIVQATQMTQTDFLKSQGKYQENQETYGDGYLVVYEDGYRSWSPKDVFERCYRLLTKKEISMIY